MAIQLSLTNHIAGATVSFITGTASSGYPLTNIRTAWKPFQPLITTTTDQLAILIDYGAARDVDVWAAIRVNVPIVELWADSTATFNSGGGAAFSSPMYKAQNLATGLALNGRYHLSHKPPTRVTARYNMALFPVGQTPVATPPHAAGAGYYVAGALWGGPLATVPRDILAEPELERLEPYEDVELPSGGRSRSIVGYPYVTLGARRLANQDVTGLDTELRAWLALDAQWWAADYALVLPRSTVASDAYIMRRLKGTSWTWSRAYSEGDLLLEEVTG